MESDSRTGAVTFLFTDIEGSTRLWEEQPEKMRQALARHDTLTRQVVEGNRGTVVKMVGDGVHAAFAEPLDALVATVQLQQALADPHATSDIALHVRCGLHAGVVEQRDSDYFGSAVNRAARIMNAAHGGQILLSRAVVGSIDDRLPAHVALRDLGLVRLRDLASPERIYQILHPELRQDFPALRSLEATPNNLPQQLTSFIGREKEIEEVKALLGRTRLLTLTGAGGCGKTRLAVHVVADVLDSYPDGVWLVEVAALANPAFIPHAVAMVLGLKEEPGRSLTQTLTEHLKPRKLLIVLDNAEHLLAACAQLADAVLRQCPQVVVLVSSREGLGITGELTYRVPSLSFPDPQRDAKPEGLLEYESVRLFVERAQFHRPQFALTRQNAPALASVCFRLDGIPLAIELAAARVRSLSVEEVNRRLDQRFQLLTGGSRTALPRQQTLRSMIDWSYDLLTDPEQALLCRSAVFAGGWTMDAAEHACVGEGIDHRDVLDLLTSLIDKSLVIAEERNDATRYRLLETVREYAREKLAESGDGAAARDRHRDYFLALTEQAEPKIFLGAEQAEWLHRLDEEHENLRLALEWSVAYAESTSGLRLCSALRRFWYMRGHLSEGRQWCTRALGRTGSDERTRERAKVLDAAGVLAHYQADYSAARALLEESLAIGRQLGDLTIMASSLNNLGTVIYAQGDYRNAAALHEESLAIRQELGDRRGVAASLNNLGNLASDQLNFDAALTLYNECLAIMRELENRGGIANSLYNLGNVAYARDDYPVARALYEECLPIQRGLGNRLGIADALQMLGDVAFEEGDYRSARTLYQEGLSIVRELGHRGRISTALAGLAAVVARQGSPIRAARIWGVAERLRDEVGSPLSSRDRPRYDRRVDTARATAVDDVAFDRARQEGRALSLEQAIIAALEGDSVN